MAEHHDTGTPSRVHPSETARHYRSLEAHIKFEVTYTPLSWQKRYNLVKGATHGLSHTLMQLGYLRPRHQHARYPNVFFVGASTHPGTGVPTALISAHQVADHVVDYVRDSSMA